MIYSFVKTTEDILRLDHNTTKEVYHLLNKMLYRNNEIYWMFDSIFKSFVPSYYRSYFILYEFL